MYIRPEMTRQIIGKLISDSYGRKCGLILGFTKDSKMNILTWILQSNGVLSSHPLSQITQDDDLLILNNSWSIRANKVETELTIAYQKISVLNKLYNNGEITKEAYLKIQETSENVIKSLTKRYESLINHASERLDDLNSQIEYMELLLANLKVDQALELVKENDYSTITESLQIILNQATAEKKDIEITLKELSSESLGTSLKNKDVSIQPILLRIQEAGL